MKKLLYVFMASVLFACSTSNQLSNFSKQKYTKKFHRKTMKYDDNVNEYANNSTVVNDIKNYAALTIEKKTPTITKSNLYKPKFKQILDAKKRNFTTNKSNIEQNATSLKQSTTKTESKNFTFNKKQLRKKFKNTLKNKNSSSTDIVKLILAIIFLFVLYPVSVALVGDSSQFKLNLILFLGGLLLLILGFVILPLLIIASILLLAGWLHAIYVVATNI